MLFIIKINTPINETDIESADTIRPHEPVLSAVTRYKDTEVLKSVHQPRNRVGLRKKPNSCEPLANELHLVFLPSSNRRKHADQ